MIADLLVGPRDPIRLDTFRLATGLGLLGYMAQWWFDGAAEWLTVDGFHLSPAAAGPGWLSPPPLPVWALAPFGAAFFASLLAFTLGYRRRIATLATLLLLIYVGHVDPLASFTPNELFIVSLSVLLVAPSGSYWTLDRAPVRQISAWPVRVLQATLVVSYVIAGVCKLSPGDWLSNSHALRTFVEGPYRTTLAAWALRSLPWQAWTLMQSLSLAFELLAPLLFAVRRLRWTACVWGFGMHASIGLFMDEFWWFAFQMLSFYVLFIDDRALHAVRDRLARLGNRQLSAPAGS